MSAPIGLIFELPGTQTTFIPWGQATYALFGKNGVGKSRTLAAVNHLFNGGAQHEPRPTRDADLYRSTCSLIVEARLPERPSTAESADLAQESGWESDTFYGFLSDYLLHIVPNIGDFSNSQVRGAYEQYIDSEVQAWSMPWMGKPWNEDPSLWRSVLEQRYFEITRDELDRVVVRPCYLESREHPDLNAYMATLRDRPKASGLESHPFDIEWLSTLEGEQIWFASIGIGSKWHRPDNISPGYETGYRCVDLRSEPEPDVMTVGNHLAQLLKEGADLEAWANELSQEATKHLRRALPTSVGLQLQVPDHADLLRGKKVEWMAAVPGERLMGKPSLLPFRQLSTAEATWASLAIERATADMTDGSSGRLLIIDEPEQGLHRSAERQALSWLAELGQAESTWVWCATHSPALLSDERVAPVAVREEFYARGGGVSRFSGMKLLGSAERGELQELGLTTTDLLSTRRGFLLVEGAHDETVLTEVIGKELADLSIEILALRGASNLPGAIEARTLFDFTDALLLALLDGIPAEGLSAAWAEARKHVDAPETARRVLFEGIDWPNNTESEWMQEWLMRSITRGRGRHARIEPLGVSKADIIEYLPVQSFVPSAASWEDLRVEHAERRAAAKRVPKDFKRWLTMTYGADFEPTTIREACQRLDHIPNDFINVLRQSANALHTYESNLPG
ncbi:hypothetical protein CWN80_01965 [Janibacter hoylei PVAS-1]|uniref:Uncharacterized protein n=2 Tax=Janibacter hoylei PVAS-1 TaxID=1210046 RepID=A0A444BBF5_9MICO|nr:AAA family ATPase [Janibacter hoylei]RWU85752.1 hypothetical protein CWN80_01965 [Janibacter hoylei PVAS-1]